MVKKIIVFMFMLLFPSLAPAATTWNASNCSQYITLSNGNMTATAQSSFGGCTWVCVTATTPITAGKIYFEMQIQSQSYSTMPGVASASNNVCDGFPGSASGQCGYLAFNGYKYIAGSGSAYGASFHTAVTVIGIAVDMDNGRIWFSKANTWQNSGDPAAGTGYATNTLSGTLYPAIAFAGGSQYAILRTSASDCSYSPPSEFNYLDMSTISGTLKEHETDASGKAYEYLLIDASSTPHALYAYGTAESDGTWTENVADTDDEYCGIMYDNIGGAVYSGDWATDLTNASGEFTLTEADWADGDTVWVAVVDPDKTYKTLVDSFTANSSHQVTGVYKQAGSVYEGGLVIGFGFGTTAGTYNPKPIFDFATGN